MKVAIAEDYDSGEYYIRQFTDPCVPASFAPPDEWAAEELVEIPESVLATYIQHRLQDGAMQILLGLIKRDQHPREP